MMDAIHRGEIKGLLSICFNPLVSLPDAEYTRAALEKLEFFCVIDFFMSETARHADVILAGSLHEEDEGTVTTAEGRVVRIRQAVTPPGQARVDWKILCDLARRFAPFEKFPYACAEDIFRELRAVSRGGLVDYSGITYDRIEQEHGVFWPCPSLGHPGTPRLFEGGRFAHPDGRARFHAVEYRPPAEDVDGEYPVILTTGRVVSQFLSGTQTRRIGPLVDQYPEPLLEIHPELAARHGLAAGDRVRVVEPPRRGRRWPAAWCGASGPDTVFMPYHWADEKSANRLTVRALDPVSKIPEFKVCAVRLERAVDGRAWILHRSVALHRLPGLLPRLRRVRDPPRAVDDPPRVRRARASRPDGARRLHALRGPGLREGLPGRRHQEDGGRHRPVGPRVARASAARTASWPALRRARDTWRASTR